MLGLGAIGKNVTIDTRKMDVLLHCPVTATCKMWTGRYADRQRVKRRPEFADRKCGPVGKMRTLILRTKWSIVIILKNRQNTQ